MNSGGKKSIKTSLKLLKLLLQLILSAVHCMLIMFQTKLNALNNSSAVLVFLMHKIVDVVSRHMHWFAHDGAC